RSWRNIDKVATIRVLLEDNKEKTAEITHLKGEKDLEKKKNEAFISMAEEIGDYVLKARLHLESKVPKKFPSAMHYVRTLVDLVLEDGPIRMPAPKDPEQEVERARASVVRKISSYEALHKTLQDELKKVDQALNICATPEVVIRIRTIIEDNEVLKVMKDETLGHAEILALVKKKCEALAATHNPHKERLDEIGKLIA
ncbi:hypothetical protein KI387_022427, partial [Taxus chinensis]